MKYELPPLPGYDWYEGYSEDDMRQYAEQAVAPLLAEIERLERFISDSFEVHPNLDLDVESLTKK